MKRISAKPRSSQFETPPIIFFTCLITVQAGAVTSIILDSQHNDYFTVIMNAIFGCINIALFFLVRNNRLSARIGLLVLAMCCVSTLQLSVVQKLVSNSLSDYDLSNLFCTSILVVLLSFAILGVLNRKLGFWISVLGFADMVVVQLLINGPSTFYYATFIPAVGIGSSWSVYYFRAHLDRLISYLEETKGTLNKVSLAQKGITQAESRCIHYLQQFYTTKEIASKEGCSESAIQARLGSIYSKLGVADKPALMYFIGRHEVVYDSPDK